MQGVQFNEEKSYYTTGGSGASGMANFLINKGLVKTPEQANFVLILVAVVLIAIAFIVPNLLSKKAETKVISPSEDKSLQEY